jgi:hypothetical protein
MQKTTYKKQTTELSAVANSSIISLPAKMRQEMQLKQPYIFVLKEYNFLTHTFIKYVTL